MKLSEYLSYKSMSQTAFAKTLSPPVTQGLVSQWILGKCRIPLHRAIEIKKITKGKVDVFEWPAFVPKRSNKSA